MDNGPDWVIDHVTVRWHQCRAPTCCDQFWNTRKYFIVWDMLIVVQLVMLLSIMPLACSAFYDPFVLDVKQGWLWREGPFGSFKTTNCTHTYSCKETFALIFHKQPVYIRNVDHQSLFFHFYARAQNVLKRSCHLSSFGPCGKGKLADKPYRLF